MANLLRLVALTVLLASNEERGQGARHFIQGRLDRQNAHYITLTADDPRPLYQVLEALRKEYGLAVDYEDPPYTESELMPLGALKTARGGFFTVTVPLEVSPSRAEIEAAIRAIVSKYDASGDTGHFEVRGSASVRISVIGKPSDDSTPILDTPITLSKASRSLDATLTAICDEVSTRRGVKIEQAGILDNSLALTQITVGGINLPARELLAESLAHSSVARLWIMTYDPGDNSYAIAFPPVTRWETKPDGSKHQVTVPNERFEPAARMTSQ